MNLPIQRHRHQWRKVANATATVFLEICDVCRKTKEERLYTGKKIRTRRKGYA